MLVPSNYYATTRPITEPAAKHILQHFLTGFHTGLSSSIISESLTRNKHVASEAGVKAVYSIRVIHTCNFKSMDQHYSDISNKHSYLSHYMIPLTKSA